MTALPPFQALLDEHASEVMAVLRGAVGGTDADDCFQDTFLAALRAYPKLDNDRNLRGWLLTIAHRKAIDHHRSNGRRPLPVGTGNEVEDAADGRADHESFEESVLAEEGVWEFVGALPPKQRAAVTLRYACDLPHAAIAAALGCSPDAARRNLHEGMKRLRADLSVEESSPRKDPS